jgi:cytidyltransferase-like protein
MKLSQILEAIGDKKVVVVYGGRFQPFHKGHYEAYQWLCKKFGENNVWIATSNKTNFDPKKGDISPFTYKEKKEIMVSLYDINPRRIILCKNPAFKPEEVFKLYKGFKIIYINAVGKKDEERYTKGTFFKPLPRPFSMKEAEMLDSIEDSVGYYIDVPMQTKELSGTIVRDDLIHSKGDDREEAFKKYFGKYDSTIDSLFVAKLKDVKKEEEEDE